MNKKKTKRTESKKKQPYQLTNFSPFSTIASWTWRKCIRIIIKSDYFSTFYAFVASFSWFFTCCVHNNNFKKLITCFKVNSAFETLLATFLSRAHFNFLGYSCRRSSCSFSRRNELPCSCISYSGRSFTHFEKILIKQSIITYYLTEKNKFSST